jgi:HKD family nuclease
VIADPINDVYGGLPSRDLAALRGAGIEVVTPDLDSLRDSNAIYSAFWRLTMSWWAGDGSGDAYLPNPLDAGPDRVSIGAWARLLNFKADHRKVIIGDDGKGGITGIVTSANPHDASSQHSNVALKVSGSALAPLLESELAIATDGGWTAGWKAPPPKATAAPAPENMARVQVLTESEIRAAIVRNFTGTRVGDSIDIAMFYLSDRTVIQALLAAAKRGVSVRVLLDPNKDAFGRTKNGIPNRSVATELAAASDGAIKVRWFRTHGEQFHSKLVALRTASEFWFTLGSANLTRRNLEDFNLEANVAASVPLNAEIAAQISTWFESLWTNRGPPELEYTAEFGAYADPAQSSYWLYRIMEATGLSTF